MVTADLETRTVDPVTFEILSHRLHQIAMEIGVTLERVGGTVNTTQMHDYINALYRANGDIMATGNSSGWHVACAGFAVKRIIERFADDEGIDPGDMFLLNDPYVAAIHQSDVYIISPIHVGERLVAWSATFVHVMDIGARSPGGNSPGATEICHEGVRIPGIKLIERGKLRRDVFDAITNMTRQPAMVALDLKCEIAANNVARARVQELCAQYGSEILDVVSSEMIRYSEQILRKRLKEIPDGTWSATSYVETTETWKVMLTLTKESDRLLFDFTGTDPQASVGINLPYHATVGACFGSVLGLLGYDIPKNQGAFGPIEVIAPPGTILNVQSPAPVSLNTTSGGAVAKFLTDSVMTQMAATSEQWYGEAMAKRVGGRRARHAGTNQFGRYYVSSFGGLAGTGAGSQGDGIDSGGSLTVHNIEWVEASFPLLYLYRRHVMDGGGAGKYRGGAADEVALVVHDAPDGRIKGVAYGVAGLRNGGQGLFGGYPGGPSVVSIVENVRVDEAFAEGTAPVDLDALGGTVRILDYCDFDLEAGDVFCLVSANGGGFGDPLERDPLAVARDVIQFLVSPQAANDVYGVVLRGDAVDWQASELARDRLREQRIPIGVPRSSAASRSPVPVRTSGVGPSHPLRECLEVAGDPPTAVIRCTRCGHELCGAELDWTEFCQRVLLSPTAAGPLMAALVPQFQIQQLCCPSCGALLDTDIVEAELAPVA